MVNLDVNKINIHDILKEKCSQLRKKEVWTTLLKVDSKKHLEIDTEVLNIITNDMGQQCIYVALSKPFSELNKLFRSKKINLSNLYFIDAISQMYGLKCVPVKNCIYTPGTPNIETIAASLQELLCKLKVEKKCVVLDSIHTLLLYNSLPETVKCSQSLTQTLKEMRANVVMISAVEGATTEKLIKELSKLCDVTINIK